MGSNRKKGRKRTKSGGSKPKSPGRSSFVHVSRFISGKQETSQEQIYLTPKPHAEHVQILLCDDKTFMLRHRRSDTAESALFPCPLVIEWQIEFLFDEVAVNLLAMYPKIITLE